MTIHPKKKKEKKKGMREEREKEKGRRGEKKKRKRKHTYSHLRIYLCFRGMQKHYFTSNCLFMKKSFDNYVSFWCCF